LWTIPGTERRSDVGLGFQLVAGFDYAITRESTLGFEYRRLSLGADFGPGLDAMNLGGGMAMLKFRLPF
jgi:opacity protein-like surface antigen